MPTGHETRAGGAHRSNGAGRPRRGTGTAVLANDTTDDFVRTREAIIRAAAEVFSRNGFQAGTTKDIAARVGLSQPALYYYIGSKETLLSELGMRLDRDMAATLERAQDVAAEPREQLKAFIHELTRAVADDTHLFGVYWADSEWLPENVAAQVRADERRFVRQVEELIERVQAAGGLPAGPPHVLAEGILGMVLWMYRWYRGPKAVDADQVASLFLQMLNLDP